MKKIILIFLSFILLASFSLAVYAATYIGNKNSYKFHYQGCQWEKKMHTQNKVAFSTRQAALNAGYVPCKVCKP